MIARYHRRTIRVSQPHRLFQRLRLPRLPRLPALRPRRRRDALQIRKRVRVIRLRRMHPRQQRLDQRPILRLFVKQPELPPHAREPVTLVTFPEPTERLVRQRDRRLLLRMQHRQQRLRQSREIPLRDLRLIPISVTPIAVDRAKHRRRIIGLHKRTRPVIDRLTRERHVVRVHHPVHKSDAHPLRDQSRLSLDHRPEQRERRILRARQLRIMPLQRIRDERAQRRLVPSRRHPLKRPHADVARRHPRQHGARPRSVLPPDLLARRYDCETARRWNPHRVHRLANHILAQHRAERRAPVTTPRIRGRPRPLELHIPALTPRRDLLTQQNRPPIAQRREVPVLVSRISLRERRRTRRQHVPRKNLRRRPTRALRTRPRRRVQPQLLRQFPIPHRHPRRAHRRRPHRHVQQTGQLRIRMLQAPATPRALRKIMFGHPRDSDDGARLVKFRSSSDAHLARIFSTARSPFRPVHSLSRP